MLTKNDEIEQVIEENTGSKLEKQALLSVKKSEKKPIRYSKALKKNLYLSATTSLSRVVTGAIGFINAITLSKLSASEIAAGPLITTFTYVTIGTARGMFTATGIISGNLKGAKEYSKIGDVIRGSWIFGCFVTVPAIGILLAAPSLSKLVGTSDDVADAVNKFFIPYSIGILPTSFFLNDQQFAISIGWPMLATASSTIYTLINVTCGAALSLGWLNLPRLGVSGLGWGAAIAAWVTFFFTRGFFLIDSLWNNNYRRVLILPEGSQDPFEISDGTIELTKEGNQVTAHYMRFQQVRRKTLDLATKTSILELFSSELHEITAEDFVSEIALMFGCVYFRPYNLFKFNLKEMISYSKYNQILMLLEDNPLPHQIANNTIVLHKQGNKAIAYWGANRIPQRIIELNKHVDIIENFSSNPHVITEHAFVSKIRSICGLTLYIKDLISLGWKTGLQVTSEWGNFTILTLMMGSLGKDALTAEQVSIQYMNAFTLVILGASQATSILVAQYVGKQKKAEDANNNNLAIIYRTNARKIGNAGIVVGLGFSTVIGVLFITIPRQLSSTLIDIHDEENSDILVLAQAMLLANGIGFIIDSVRNLCCGALRGYKDVLFATILSLLTMGVVGSLFGYVGAFPMDMGPNSLFITRDIGIILAAIGTVYRWHKISCQPDKNNIEQYNACTESVNNRYNFWQRNRSRGTRLILNDDISIENVSIQVSGATGNQNFR